MSDLNDTLPRESKPPKCFFKFLPVDIAAQIICGFALLFYAFFTVGFFLPTNPFLDYWDGGRIIIGICAFTGVIIGIHESNPDYFVFCLFWIGSHILINIFGFLFTIINNFSGSVFTLTEIRNYCSGKRLFECLIFDKSFQYSVMLILYLFILDIIYKCYKYVDEKAREKKVILLHLTVNNNPSAAQQKPYIHVTDEHIFRV